MTLSLSLVLALVASANAHQALWDKGMFCLGGPGGNDMNSNQIVDPMYQMKFSDWWFHAYNGCTNPPPDGQYMELPAGGTYHGVIANNQAFTPYGFNGKYAGEWPDGKPAPVYGDNGDCVKSPLLHAHNQSDAAGTALAIADVENLSDVTPENLVVFSVAYNTPWKSAISFDIPADMPTCKGRWCICSWGWVPNHCGQENMSMNGYRCRITGSTSTKKIGKPKPPTWCENNPSSCTTGPKQMIYFHQLEGNNVEFAPNVFQSDGATRSPNYNMKMGFKDGAQLDIFVDGDDAPPSPPSSSSAKPSSTAAPERTTSSVAVRIVSTSSSSAAPEVPTTTSSKAQAPSSSTSPHSQAPPLPSSSSSSSSSSHSQAPPPSSSSSLPASSSVPPPPPPPPATTSTSTSVVVKTIHTHAHHHTHTVSPASSSVGTTSNVLLALSTSTASTQAPTTTSAKAKHCSNRKRRRSSAKRHSEAKRYYEAHHQHDGFSS